MYYKAWKQSNVCTWQIYCGSTYRKVPKNIVLYPVIFFSTLFILEILSKKTKQIKFKQKDQPNDLVISWFCSSRFIQTMFFFFSHNILMLKTQKKITYFRNTSCYLRNNSLINCSGYLNAMKSVCSLNLTYMGLKTIL